MSDVSARGYVYLVASEPLSSVKVGWSLIPKQRIKDLTLANPSVQLVAYFPSPRKIEKIFHHTFSHLRFSGEWFFVADKQERKDLIDTFLACMVWSHIATGEPAWIAPRFEEAYQRWREVAESVRKEMDFGPN